MKRIAIIGCSGAGKTTLAHALSARLGIEAYHLDRIFLDCGGQDPQQGSFRSEHARLLDLPAWIIDGNFGGTMPARFARADTIIFLDLPVHACLWGVIQRKFLGSGSLRTGNRNRLTWIHLRYILFRHRRRQRPAILQKLGAVSGAKNVLILRSRAETRALLAAIARLPAPAESEQRAIPLTA